MGGKNRDKSLDDYLTEVAEKLARLIADDEFGSCLTAECGEITRHSSGYCRICRVRTCRRCNRGFTLGAAIGRSERQNYCAQCAKLKTVQRGGQNE